MAQAQPDPRAIQTFEDLNHVSDEVLRQVAMRVHIIDLAYAFRTANDLRDRLLGAIRPELAEQILSALRTVEWESQRYPPDEQTRTARARVMEVVRLETGQGP